MRAGGQGALIQVVSEVGNCESSMSGNLRKQTCVLPQLLCSRNVVIRFKKVKTFRKTGLYWQQRKKNIWFHLHLEPFSVI